MPTHLHHVAGVWLLLAGVWLLASANPAAGQGAVAREPTQKEQFMVYEINRARSDPESWAIEQKIGVDLSYVEARPPLALNHSLTGSGAYHANEMGAEQYFAHRSPITMEYANKWARDAGYPLATGLPDGTNSIESIACGFGNPPAGTPMQLPLEALKSLIADVGVVPPGHRNHLLGIGNFSVMREVGAGYESVGTFCRNYWAIHTGYRNDNPLWLTGVVYADRNRNGLFDEGEGLASVDVQVGAVTVQSGTAGGWSLPVDPGNHPVSCSGAGFGGTASETVFVSDRNRAVDCLSGEAVPVVDYGLIPAPEPSASWLQLAASASLLSLAARRRSRCPGMTEHNSNARYAPGHLSS